MPRSGTRSVANIINSSDEVIITDEFPSGITEKMFSLVKGMDIFFNKRDYKNADEWNKRKIELIHDIWLANSLVSEVDKNVKYVGNKTPSNEFFFDEYESFMSFDLPKYVYCLRHPLKVVESLKNMPWNKSSVTENLERWKESYCIYQNMKKKCKNRVISVCFDNERDANYGILGKKIFSFMGIAYTEIIDNKLGEKIPSQPRESVLKGKPLTPLTAKEKNLFYSDPFFSEVEEFNFE